MRLQHVHVNIYTTYIHTYIVNIHTAALVSYAGELEGGCQGCVYGLQSFLLE